MFQEISIQLTVISNIQYNVTHYTGKAITINLIIVWKYKFELVLNRHL